MELDVERHSLALGRHGQGVEGVNAPLFVPHGAAGRLALGSPSAFKVGDEQKATLIQENQVRPQARRLFLYGATRTASSARWRFRCVDTRAVQVSDNSSPSVARDTTRHWGGSECETLARRLWQCAPTSTTQSGSPWPVPRALRLGPSESFAQGRDKRVGPEWAEHVSQACPVADRCAPTARRSSVLRQLSGRLSPVICLAAIVGSHGAAAVAIGLLLLGVSYPKG